MEQELEQYRNQDDVAAALFFLNPDHTQEAGISIKVKVMQLPIHQDIGVDNEVVRAEDQQNNEHRNLIDSVFFQLERILIVRILS